MKKTGYIMLLLIAILTLSTGAFAQAPSAFGVQSDTVAVQNKGTPVAQSPAAPGKHSFGTSQNKQSSVVRPTKSTNWSKIKTLFE